MHELLSHTMTLRATHGHPPGPSATSRVAAVPRRGQCNQRRDISERV